MDASLISSHYFFWPDYPLDTAGWGLIRRDHYVTERPGEPTGSSCMTTVGGGIMLRSCREGPCNTGDEYPDADLCRRRLEGLRTAGIDVSSSKVVAFETGTRYAYCPKSAKIVKEPYHSLRWERVRT